MDLANVSCPKAQTGRSKPLGAHETQISSRRLLSMVILVFTLYKRHTFPTNLPRRLARVRLQTIFSPDWANKSLLIKTPMSSRSINRQSGCVDLFPRHLALAGCSQARQTSPARMESTKVEWSTYAMWSPSKVSLTEHNSSTRAQTTRPSWKSFATLARDNKKPPLGKRCKRYSRQTLGMSWSNCWAFPRKMWQSKFKRRSNSSLPSTPPPKRQNRSTAPPLPKPNPSPTLETTSRSRAYSPTRRVLLVPISSPPWHQVRSKITFSKTSSLTKLESQHLPSR